MSFDRITNTEIAAYKPLTGRLLEKYRQHDQHNGYHPLHGCEQVVDVASELGDFADIDTISIYVPANTLGDGGTRIVVVATLQISDTGGTTTGYFRLKHGSDVGDTQSESAGDETIDAIKTFTLDFTPTGDQNETITIQGYFTKSGSAGGASFRWKPEQVGYLVPLPLG